MMGLCTFIIVTLYFIEKKSKKLWYLNGIRMNKERWFSFLTAEQKIAALFNEENW
jgi:hypothetical protein